MIFFSSGFCVSNSYLIHGGIGLEPRSVLLLKVLGSILSGANLRGLV